MTADLDDIDFEQLIGSRDIDVYELIEEINKHGIARALYFYALFTIKGRWPEAELYMQKDPAVAYYYAQHIIKDRWPVAEPYIKEELYWAKHYFKRFGVKL